MLTYIWLAPGEDWPPQHPLDVVSKRGRAGRGQVLSRCVGGQSEAAVLVGAGPVCLPFQHQGNKHSEHCHFTIIAQF